MTIFSEVLIFAAFWLFAVLSTLFYMHMFQLNSYRADDQWHWMLKNRGKVVPLALPLIGAVIGVICGKNAGMIVCAVFILLACLFYKPKKAKKPLKYTPRVRRMLVTVAVLYVAMTVLLAVFASGRITALVVGLVAAASPFGIILANIINKPIELSINRYYTNDAKKMLAACPNLTVIGVTGSYGKTSVKFYLNTLLKAKYNVLMTPELQHSHGRRQDRARFAQSDARNLHLRDGREICRRYKRAVRYSPPEARHNNLDRPSASRELQVSSECYQHEVRARRCTAEGRHAVLERRQ